MFIPHLVIFFSQLVGHRLKGRDVRKAGVATHVCDSARIGELEESLLKLESTYPEDIAAVLNQFDQVIYMMLSFLHSDVLLLPLVIQSYMYTFHFLNVNHN